MTGHAIHQRCWNHESREAVCRCPGCGNSFCRECVTEHEFRLLCASCLAGLAKEKQSSKVAGGIGVRRLMPGAMALAGIVIAWMVFFGAAESILTIAVRTEQAAWQNR